MLATCRRHRGSGPAGPSDTLAMAAAADIFKATAEMAARTTPPRHTTVPALRFEHTVKDGGKHTRGRGFFSTCLCMTTRRAGTRMHRGASRTPRTKQTVYVSRRVLAILSRAMGSSRGRACIWYIPLNKASALQQDG